MKEDVGMSDEQLLYQEREKEKKPGAYGLTQRSTNDLSRLIRQGFGILISYEGTRRQNQVCG